MSAFIERHPALLLFALAVLTVAALYTVVGVAELASTWTAAGGSELIEAGHRRP